MLLGRDRDSIPHFYDRGVTMKEGDVIVDAFMKANDLHQISVFMDGDSYDLTDVLAYREQYSSLPYILGCRSPITNHSVVVEAGFIYNPSLTSNEIVGPMSDGRWWITYIVKRPT